MIIEANRLSARRYTGCRLSFNDDNRLRSYSRAPQLTAAALMPACLRVPAQRNPEHFNRGDLNEKSIEAAQRMPRAIEAISSEKLKARRLSHQSDSTMTV